MSEDDFQWDPSPPTKTGKISKRTPLPVSETLRVFRALMPDIQEMKAGDEHFIPTLDAREEYVVMSEVRKANAKHFDRRWLAFSEWRRHIRGKLVVCVSPEAADDWAELHRMMLNAVRVNRRLPPLDPEGNALVPRLTRT